MSIMTVDNENPRWVGREYRCPRGHAFTFEKKDEKRLDTSQVSSDYGNVSAQCPECGATVIIPWIDLASDARLDQAMGKTSPPPKKT